jgi:hypothetical protein
MQDVTETQDKKRKDSEEEEEVEERSSVRKSLNLLIEYGRNEILLRSASESGIWKKRLLKNGLKSSYPPKLSNPVSPDELTQKLEKTHLEQTKQMGAIPNPSTVVIEVSSSSSSSSGSSPLLMRTSM